VTIEGEVLVQGTEAAGEAMALTAPISFWGGVNPKTGEIADVRHPEYQQCISGRVVMIPATIGSSSAAAVLLELVHAGRAPAALILHEPDAILLLGLIVAREMGLATPLALKIDRSHFAGLHGRRVAAHRDGRITA
jgi:predicted aconitase with swiveling domain